MHLLELDEQQRLELRLHGTIQLRPSTLISCEDLDAFADAEVEIVCTYTPGELYTPPKPGDPDFFLQRPIGPVIDGEEQPLARGRGFTVEKIRRLEPAPTAQ